MSTDLLALAKPTFGHHGLVDKSGRPEQSRDCMITTLLTLLGGRLGSSSRLGGFVIFLLKFSHAISSRTFLPPPFCCAWKTCTGRSVEKMMLHVRKQHERELKRSNNVGLMSGEANRGRHTPPV
jgi:hypothetical protein